MYYTFFYLHWLFPTYFKFSLTFSHSTSKFRNLKLQPTTRIDQKLFPPNKQRPCTIKTLIFPQTPHPDFIVNTFSTPKPTLTHLLTIENNRLEIVTPTIPHKFITFRTFPATHKRNRHPSKLNFHTADPFAHTHPDRRL